MPKPALLQPSLFDDAAPADTLPTLGIAGSTPVLGKAQKLFNTLIAKIEAQRQLLKQWDDYIPAFQRRLAADIQPLNERLRERRIAMAHLLDIAMDHKALGKTHREKVRDILLGQLESLLAEIDEDDPVHAELVAMHDRHGDISFEDARREDMALTAEAARGMFGLDLDEDHGATTPDELARLIGEKLRARQSDGDEPEPPKKKSKPVSAKTAAREAAREQAAQGASAAIRSVYRQLASALHPDREPDLAERERKTALMQRVNQAYDAADLLALLELQLQIEQIDTHALSQLAQERLGHYNHVLQEQLQRLQEQLAEITAPFAGSLGASGSRHLTPQSVERAIDSDVRNLQHLLAGLDDDLRRFADVKELKASLRHYRVGDVGGGEEEEILRQVMAELAQRRSRGRGSR